MENINNEKKSKDNKNNVYLDYNIFKGRVKVVGDNGTVTVMDRDKAISIAKSKGLNLIQVGYNKNDNPRVVCKMVNYGKYLYDQKKRDKENARRSREANADAKEVYFSIRIDDGDLKTKISHIRSFLEDDKAKVKVGVKLLRREMSLTDMAKDMMKNILSKVDDVAEMDSAPNFTGNVISCVLRPKKRS